MRSLSQSMTWFLALLFSVGPLPAGEIHEAVQNNMALTLRTLLAKQASLAADLDQQGFTPLHYAAANNNTNAAALLLEAGADINARGPNGVEPIHLAALKGHTQMLRYLLAHGADINAQTKDGFTPLHMASRKRSLQAALLLIKQGADIQAQTAAGATPLETAVLAGNENLLAQLLEHGADPNAGGGRNTPLFSAIALNRPDLVALLLDHGANVNATNAAGSTPLVFAVTAHQKETVKLLLQQGANPEAGEPAQLAAASGDREVAHLLSEYQANRTRQLERLRRKPPAQTVTPAAPPALRPCIECFADRVILYPDRRTVYAEKFNATRSPLRDYLDARQAEGGGRLLLVARPGSLKVYRLVSRLALERNLQAELRLAPSGTAIADLLNEKEKK